jgi:hypothetical protein
MDWVAIRAALQNWVVACTGLSSQKVVWARQRNAPRPAEDAIIMKLYVVDDMGTSWVDTEYRPLVFADKTITSVVGNNLRSVGHGLLTGDGPGLLHGADLPQPLLEDTDYWVIRVDDDTFQVAAQYEDTGGGDATGNPITPITLTDAGSGAMTFTSTSKTLRAGQEINFVQRGTVRATLQLFSYVQDDTGIDGAIATLRRVANRHKLPSNQAIIDAVGVSVSSMERTRSMLGTRDAVLFEPRAWIDIDLLMSFAERETGTIIGRVAVEKQAPAPTWQETIENEDL